VNRQPGTIHSPQCTSIDRTFGSEIKPASDALHTERYLRRSSCDPAPGSRQPMATGTVVLRTVIDCGMMHLHRDRPQMLITDSG